MFFRILKKELKKKKAMNIIVLLFITLAAMFVGAGLNNVISVTNGTGYYLEQAGVGDFDIITMGPDSIGALDEMLATEPAIKEYRLDTVIYGSQDSLKKEDGSRPETSWSCRTFRSPLSTSLIKIIIRQKHSSPATAMLPATSCRRTT